MTRTRHRGPSSLPAPRATRACYYKRPLHTSDLSDDSTVGDAVQVGSSAGEVEALQLELERVKRSRGEYAAARVATELEKQSQQLQDEMEKKLEAAHAKAAQAAQEAAEQAAQAAQEAAEETALLRAELALLKEKSE